MNQIDRLLILPRAVLVLVMMFHGIGKFYALDSFQNKFDLPASLGILAGVAEVLASVGLSFGVVVNGKFGSAVTILGTAAIAMVQVPAIFLAHWGEFFYFTGGMEYNLVILALCATIAIGTVLSYRSKYPEQQPQHQAPSTRRTST